MAAQRQHLSVTDVIALIICWGACVGLVYITKDVFFWICALIGTYYLSRWIILRG